MGSRKLDWTAITLVVMVFAMFQLWSPAQSPPEPDPVLKIVGPPGRYAIEATSQVTITQGKGYTLFQWAAGTVPPVNPPDPPTKPPVTPDPPTPGPPGPVTVPSGVGGPVFLIAVWDKTKGPSLPQGQQQIFTAQTKASLKAKLEPQKIYWSPYDVSDPVVIGWKDDAVRHGLPCIIVAGTGGAILATVPLPSDEAGIMEIARTLRSPSN